MTWIMYEVWAEAEDGSDELVDTTASLKEAKALRDATPDSYILSEDENGNIIEVD